MLRERADLGLGGEAQVPPPVPSGCVKHTSPPALQPSEPPGTGLGFLSSLLPWPPAFSSALQLLVKLLISQGKGW